MKNNTMYKWKVTDAFIEIKNRWISFFGEYCINEKNEILEYYRVERADSIVVLPLIDNKLLLPKRYYRHGVQKHTLDFPGGRFEKGKNKKEVVYDILQRELNVSAKNVDVVSEINKEGWIVDSSFSTQKLYGVVVRISSMDYSLNDSELMEVTKKNLLHLLSTIECLQCRSVLMTWMIKNEKDKI